MDDDNEWDLVMTDSADYAMPSQMRATFIILLVFNEVVDPAGLFYMHWRSMGEDVGIYPSSQPDRALSTLNYGLTPNCNLSLSHHGHTPITCTHTTDNSNTYLSQVSYRNLLRSQYKQGCNQCEHSYTQVYQHRNAHQMHLNAP
jgi:hypothetical protein